MMVFVLLPACAHGAMAQDKHAALGLSTTRALLFASVVGLMPFDARISNAFAETGPQNNRLLHNSASAFNDLGDPGVAIISVAAWGAGAISGSEGLEDFGFHATEAIVVSGAATGLLKGLAGRMRPNASPGDADNFKLGGGFTGRGGTSFPSGHTTAAFAFAATISQEVHLRNPAAARYVTPIVYGAASLVGVARVYTQKHWPSDVVLGAAIGTYSAHRIFALHHRKKG